jgi:gliding motility-associated-like protein
MRKNHFLLIPVLFLGLNLAAQPPETIYSGNLIVKGYLNNIPLTPGSDGPFPIGFTFSFFGTPYTSFYVSANGLVMFTDPSATYSTSVSIPDAAAPNNFIAPFWDDLAIDGSGQILYTTIGASPNRKLIIQFKNMGFYPLPPYMGTFSVILYEASSKIQLQYRLIMDETSQKAHGANATIGIENQDGTAGVLYSFHNGSAVTSSQAISFTPSGGTYTVDVNALYEGVFLTSNISLPEPGMPVLISPEGEAIIGTDQTFSWSGVSDVESYTLLISTTSDLTDAVTYNAGTSISYNVTGLNPDATYYWSVFAQNATGLTWCEIKKFTTSSTPPLAPVSQSVWVEQGKDTLIKIYYTGGDASTKTAQITSLPAQGQLYQNNSGSAGSQITTVPETLTDPEMKVIYVASGGTGNGAGSFKFKVHDDTGDSPEGEVTVNVNPPGIPNLLVTARSSKLEMQFDVPMADPAGKEGQFAVMVNGNPDPVSSVSLKPGDNNTIELILSTPLTGTETIFISYTQGSIASATGGLLLSFTGQPVTRIAQVITFPAIPVKKYGDPPFNVLASTPSGLVFTYGSSMLTVATILNRTITIRGAGNSDITAYQAGNATYAPAKYTRPMTVIKGDQVITFNPLPAKTYGDADFNPGATSSSGLTVTYTSNNNAVATITGGLIHITGAGTAVITASQTGNSNWNPAADVPQTLTVSKAGQTITFGILPVLTYGDSDTDPGASSSSGLPVSYASDNPGVATIINGMIHITGAGNAVITASQPGNENYAPAVDVTRQLTVNKADQVITFGPLTAKTYGDADFDPGASSDSGLDIVYTTDNTGVATINGSMVSITGAGTALITATQPGNSNFNPAPDVQQTLDVSKAEITFTADNKSRPYLQPNPPLTFTISGFVKSDDQSVLDVLPQIQTTAGQNSDAGDYPVTLQGGDDNNYSYIFVPGTLTVTKISQTITFTDVPEKIRVTDTYTLAASSSSGLAVLFESMNTQLAVITGNQFTGISGGAVQIRAYQQGNQNYLPAEIFADVEISSTHKNILHLFTPNNDGINDLWEIPELDTYGRCKVKVYNRWGKLVYSSTNYHNDWDGTSEGKNLPEAAYYFIIDTGSSGTITGTVNIVR